MDYECKWGPPWTQRPRSHWPSWQSMCFASGSHGLDSHWAQTFSSRISSSISWHSWLVLLSRGGVAARAVIPRCTGVKLSVTSTTLAKKSSSDTAAFCCTATLSLSLWSCHAITGSQVRLVEKVCYFAKTLSFWLSFCYRFGLRFSYAVLYLSLQRRRAGSKWIAWLGCARDAAWLDCMTAGQLRRLAAWMML